jgi:predicted O-methyltransferase YrrM
LAEGLAENGCIDTIDVNEELVDFQRKYFDRSEWSNQIVQHLGPALDIIPTLGKKYDLVFIDADKDNYINYFHAIVPMMNKSGIILSDNVLWSGKVVEEVKANDRTTKLLMEYNQLLKNDPRVETVLLPIRDGLTVSRVK